MIKYLKSASVKFENEILEASTGRVKRIWHIMPGGMLTVSLSTEKNPVEWILENNESSCDWYLYGVNEPGIECELIDVSSECIENNPYISDHIDISFEFHYKQRSIALIYKVRVYPGAPGFWTQIAVRSLLELDAKDTSSFPSWLLGSYVEKLAVETESSERIAFGYYNDSQHRYHVDMPILKEERKTGPIQKREIYDWANAVALENSSQNGLLMLKESHKCVNQDGIDTGAFILHDKDIVNSGLGFGAHYGESSFWLPNDKARTAWASWCILYDGGDIGRQMALKNFDRHRFPFRPERDTLIMANTWGTRGAGKYSQAAAESDNIKREIESCADLGIDLLQIDDGWQFAPEQSNYQEADWTPAKARFPDAWKSVCKKARDNNVELGLWFPWDTPLEKILWNYKQGSFRRFKLDFSDITTRERLDLLSAC